MAIRREGSKIIVDASVDGSVFPTSERELPFPVLITSRGELIRIAGSLYGRSLELRGDILIEGPVVSRGDTRLDPLQSRIKLLSGLTVNGTINAVASAGASDNQKSPNIRDARVIIKGDVACNQNVSFKNTIVFGSVTAVNCSLEESVVLGTCTATESLKISSSTIGGYVSRDVTFEGHCMLLNAIGESATRPIFMPRETPLGAIEQLDLRFYPLIRILGGLRNKGDFSQHKDAVYSTLYPAADWVKASATSNSALGEDDGAVYEKWVLSIGGRISDLSVVHSSIRAMTALLKCGFEFEHYHPDQKIRRVNEASTELNDDEKWLLREVCTP